MCLYTCALACKRNFPLPSYLYPLTSTLLPLTFLFSLFISFDVKVVKVRHFFRSKTYCYFDNFDSFDTYILCPSSHNKNEVTFTSRLIQN